MNERALCCPFSLLRPRLTGPVQSSLAPPPRPAPHPQPAHEHSSPPPLPLWQLSSVPQHCISQLLHNGARNTGPPSNQHLQPAITQDRIQRNETCRSAERRRNVDHRGSSNASAPYQSSEESRAPRRASTLTPNRAKMSPQRKIQEMNVQGTLAEKRGMIGDQWRGEADRRREGLHARPGAPKTPTRPHASASRTFQVSSFYRGAPLQTTFTKRRDVEATC